jgi:hypothetical protein
MSSLTEQLIAGHLAKRNNAPSPLALIEASPNEFASSGNQMDAGVQNFLGGFKSSVDRDIAARNNLIQNQNLMRGEQKELDATTLEQQLRAGEIAQQDAFTSKENALDRAARLNSPAARLNEKKIGNLEKQEATDLLTQKFIAQASERGLDPSKRPELNALAKELGIPTEDQNTMRGAFGTHFTGNVDRTLADPAAANWLKQGEQNYDQIVGAQDNQKLNEMLSPMDLTQDDVENLKRMQAGVQLSGQGDLLDLVKEVSGDENIEIGTSDIGKLASKVMQITGGNVPKGVLADFLIQAKGTTGTFEFEGDRAEADIKNYFDRLGIGKSKEARERKAGLEGYDKLLAKNQERKQRFIDETKARAGKFRLMRDAQSFNFSQGRGSKPENLGTYGQNQEDKDHLSEYLTPTQKVEGQNSVLRNPPEDTASRLFKEASQSNGQPAPVATPTQEAPQRDILAERVKALEEATAGNYTGNKSSGMAIQEARIALRDTRENLDHLSKLKANYAKHAPSTGGRGKRDADNAKKALAKFLKEHPELK